MPKTKKNSSIRTYKNLISIVGDIERSVTFTNEKKSESRADSAIITLQYSNKKTNYKTTFELNQVTYDKSSNIIKAENGKGETIETIKSTRKTQALSKTTKYKIKTPIVNFYFNVKGKSIYQVTKPIRSQ